MRIPTGPEGVLIHQGNIPAGTSHYVLPANLDSTSIRSIHITGRRRGLSWTWSLMLPTSASCATPSDLSGSG
ncbi:MAG: hypothetical protein WC718_02415 [Phycisphaerales bacterium]